jgi:hypothetical protein
MLTRRTRVFGVLVSIDTDDPRLFTLLDQRLPAFPQQPDGLEADLAYRVFTASRGNGVAVLRGRRTVAVAPDVASASERLVTDLQSTLSRTAAGWTFVHAGVVGVDDRAVLLPASSGAGKSTLVAALLCAGADYGSDEFAVLDADGCVHPYSRRLALRTTAHSKARVRPEVLGGRVLADRMRVGAVVFTEYRAGVGLDLHRISPGQVVLRLLQHCLGARGRPAEALATLRAVARDAHASAGARGEADEVAGLILARVKAGWP